MLGHHSPVSAMPEGFLGKVRASHNFSPVDKKALLDDSETLYQKAWTVDPTALKTLTLKIEYNPTHDPVQPYTSERDPNYVLCRPLCSHFKWPSPRPRKNVRLSSVTDMAPIRIQARKSDRAYNSQVYSGTLESTDGGPVPVVVKVYQTSISAYVMTLRQLERVSRSPQVWASAVQPFVTEHMAYSRMKELQGIIIPHCYGFFECYYQAKNSHFISWSAYTLFLAVEL
ncbi:hypothetical protein AURDEDRAFT_173104 [Auricularia subglabra TFB-10046 SS5]|nr:hypothetical protein AURDEDRAFT_173104 [Auricularia subglabra TFB-10046 SS5]